MIDVREMFLKLTNKLYPYGLEDDIIDILTDFKFERDSYGNYFILVKKSDDTFSDSMFTCHLDTVKTTFGNKNNPVFVNQVEDGDFIKTDGNTNLGADDKAGMTILLKMIENKIPGLYYFFIGEEVGRIGSGDLSDNYKKMVNKGIIPNINRCISFDRRGYDYVTTKQHYKTCCSDIFANKIVEELNIHGFWYATDINGGRTDSHEFIDLIPECTNLSVGYFNEHTVTESQDIEFLILLSMVVCKIDWDSLPTKRILPIYKPVRYNSLKYSSFDERDEYHNGVDSYWGRGDAY